MSLRAETVTISTASRIVKQLTFLRLGIVPPLRYVLSTMARVGVQRTKTSYRMRPCL